MFNIFQLLFIISATSIFTIYCGVQFVPERVKIVSINEKYFHNFSMAVKRYGRRSGYYINIESTTKEQWNNNVTLHLIFNEFLHNEYRRSFVEVHYRFCDLLSKEKFIGPTIASFGINCPLPPGTYRFINMTVPMEEFPSVFPFERARIDIEYTVTATGESMAKIYLYSLFKNIKH